MSYKERLRNLGFSKLEKRLWRHPNSNVAFSISKEINKVGDIDAWQDS